MKKYLLAGLVLLAGAAWLYPDDDAAAIYIKKAQDLAKKKEYKEALDNFKKAINEAPELVSAYLALGEMYRDLNESDEAVANFRKVLALIEQQGSPDKFKSVQSKINAYLAEYDKNRAESAKCREQFLQSLWSLVEKYETDDPQFALLIAERALKVDAVNILFVDKRLELSRKISEQGKEQMISLFNGADLDGWKGSEEDWQVENGAVRFECGKPEILSGLSHKAKMEGDYAITAKVKLENAYPANNFLMLSFGYQTLSNNYAFGFFDQKLVLVRHDGDKPYRKIKEKELPIGIDLADWNELTIEVFGNAVRCYLNGELCLELEETDKGNLRGLVALVGNNCAGAFKDIRYSSEE